MSSAAWEIAHAPLMEPSFESQLRGVDLHEDLIMAFRDQQIMERELLTPRQKISKKLVRLLSVLTPRRMGSPLN